MIIVFDSYISFSPCEKKKMNKYNPHGHNKYFHVMMLILYLQLFRATDILQYYCMDVQINDDVTDILMG